jgi:transposase, IS5 family
VSRDICRKIADDVSLKEIVTQPLRVARLVYEQRQHQRGPKIYSLGAPEVECIGKGKTHRPNNWVKVSVATPLQAVAAGSSSRMRQPGRAVPMTAIS